MTQKEKLLELFQLYGGKLTLGQLLARRATRLNASRDLRPVRICTC